MEVKISLWKEGKKIAICGLLFFLIVPIIIMVVTIIRIKKEIWIIGEEKVIHEYGLFSKNEEVFYMKDITDCIMNQSFWGRICKYGDLRFTIIGKKSMGIQYAKHPDEVHEFFKQLIEKTRADKPAAIVGSIG